MKITRYFIRFLLVLIILVLWMGVLVEPAPAAATGPNNLPLTVAPVHSLLHVVTAGNIDPTLTYVTYLDDPILNSVMGADYGVWVTANWNPEGDSGFYDNSPIGVWYNSTLHRWAIVNLNGAVMVAGMAFNVMFDYSNPNAFCQPTTPGNTSGPYSVMDFPQINGKPAERLIMTRYMYGTTPGSLYNHNVGVAYDSSSSRWRIYNEDGTSMGLNLSFCGLDVTGYQNSWLHIVQTTGPNLNSYGNYTWLTLFPTHQRHALFFTTHFMGDTSGGLYFSNHPLGVWFASTINSGSWSIFNQDIATMVNLDYYFVFAIEQKMIYLPLILH